jgi:LuxR family transcriptional regulator, maltose regulon positive regulatory protein
VRRSAAGRPTLCGWSAAFRRGPPYAGRVALLGTKLHVPRPRRQVVSRPRLTGQMPLGPGALPRLVLVSAPAGFGKTTLLSQWLAGWRTVQDAASRRVAWLSLDAEDSDPRRFLANVLAAIQATAPQVGLDAAALLQSDGATVVPAVLVALINDLDGLDGPIVLALDDYHVIESREVHEAMAFLLDHLPLDVGVAIATRADPPLPLTRLRTRGELLELRAADLRFTQQEAADFLNEAMGLHLEPGQVDALASRTEGWAAGLQLAGLSLRGPGDAGEFIKAFRGSHRFVLDYLVEEVLNGQPHTVRTFLRDTAVLDQLTGPLCDALTGRDDGQEMLEALERANLFVVPLDDLRQWYRYHQLFADALRSRLAAEQPERAQGLHRAAARWYAEQHRPGDAIGHAVAGQDFEHAADLIEQALPEARRQRQHQTMRRWLQGLPDDVVRRHPVVNVTVAWSRLSYGEVDAADARLREAEETLETMPAARRTASEELRQLPMTIAMYRAAIAQARGDIAGTATQARGVLDLAGPADHLARAGGAGFLGLALWAGGELDNAIETFSEAVRSLHAAGNVADELGTTVVLAGIWLALGRPAESERLYEQALAAARRRPDVALPVTGDLHVGLADALVERGDLDAAAEHLETARDLGDAGSLPENRHRWYVTMARLRQAAGDLEVAADLLQQAEALYLPGFFPEVRPIPAFRARVDIARGRLHLARNWARTYRVTPTELSYLAEYNHLTLARLLIAEHHLDKAMALLDRLRTAAGGAGREGSVAEILMLAALARHAGGDLDGAMVLLVRALETAVPAGYRRLFLDEGAPMQALLGEAAQRNVAPDLVPLLRPTSAIAMPAADGSYDAVSERELEVLRLLATELTGPEIARRLFVSVNTLRTHTKHIFTKLDVTTRQAAVRRATELGLL